MFRSRFLPLYALLAVAIAANLAPGQPPAKDLLGDPLPPGAIARFGTIRLRHDNTIVFAAFLPGGKNVISVSNDGHACVWEFPSGKEIRRFEIQSGKAPAKVTSADLSPDGKHLTAFCQDGFLHIWDWSAARETGKVATSGDAPAPTESVSPLVELLGKSKGKAASGGDANARYPVYSADGKALLLYKGSRVLQVAEFPSGKEVGPGQGHTVALTAIAFTANGESVLTRDAKAMRIWQAATGKEVEGGERKIMLPAGAGSPTLISTDGRFGVTVALFATPAAARAAEQREAIVFDAATGKKLAEIALEVDISPMHRRPLLLSPDGQLLAVNAGTDKERIDLYAVPSGKLLRSLEAGPSAAAAGFGKGKAKGGISIGQRMLFSSDGKALAFQAGTGATTLVLDALTGKQIASLPPNVGGPAFLAAFSPDRRCLALEMSDGTATIFELATGQPRFTYGGKMPPAKDELAELLGGAFGQLVLASTKTGIGLALSPDGTWLALPGPGGSVGIWDVLTGEQQAVFKGHRGAVTALAFAPNGKTLASASTDTTGLLWDITTVKRAARAKTWAADELDARWQALANEDAAKAFVALGDLVAAPRQAVDFIKDRVKPVAPLDPRHVQGLIAQLDDPQFKVRDKVTGELLKIGEHIVPLLDKALEANPSPEARGRLDALRSKMTASVLEGERLRGFRAVEVLERIGTPEARQVLQALAGGAPGALVTDSAAAALKR